VEYFRPGDRVKVKPRNEWGTIELWPDADKWVLRQYNRYLGKTGKVIEIKAHHIAPEFNVVVRLEDARNENELVWFHPVMLEKVEPEKGPLGFKLS